jgi:hypothetical protein
VVVPLQALQQWSNLQQYWCRHSPLTALQQLEAAESAGWLLQRLVTQQALQQMLCEGDVQELQQQSEVSEQYSMRWCGMMHVPVTMSQQCVHVSLFGLHGNSGRQCCVEKENRGSQSKRSRPG